jgi:hypothetical protein
LRFWNKLIYFDRTLAFDRNGLQFFGIEFYVLSLGDFIALNDVARLHFVPALSIDLAVSDSMPGLLIKLMETDLFSLGCCRIKSDRARDERELEVTFPIGTRGHDDTPTQPALRRICAL